MQGAVRQRPQHAVRKFLLINVCLLFCGRLVSSIWLMTYFLCDTPSVIEVRSVWCVCLCVVSAATYLKPQEDNIYPPQICYLLNDQIDPHLSATRGSNTRSRDGVEAAGTLRGRVPELGSVHKGKQETAPWGCLPKPGHIRLSP